MAKYVISNSTTSVGTQQAMTTTYKSLNTAVAAQSAPRRGKVYDLLVGTNGTPADNYMEWNVSRITALSTTGGTTYTAQALDPADAAALATCTSNSTTEGTITTATDLFYVGVNQRASYRWVAAPGSELVWPATSCSGMVIRARSGGYTGTATTTVYFEEQ